MLLGGALLLTPGLLTDAVGLACVLPPSRAALRSVLTGVLARRLGAGGLVGGAAASGVTRVRPRDSRIVDGEVIDGAAVDDEVVDSPVVDGEVDGEDDAPRI